MEGKNIKDASEQPGGANSFKINWELRTNLLSNFGQNMLISKVIGQAFQEKYELGAKNYSKSRILNFAQI